jgi:Carboxypeptidase regulatory-like domain
MKKQLKIQRSQFINKNEVLVSFIRTVFFITFLVVSLFSSTITAQKLPSSTTGAPLKGVDVKLGKNPGGGLAARTTTDPGGHFDLGAVPAGMYTLTLSYSDSTKSVSVMVNGSTGGQVNIGWSFQINKPFNLSSSLTAKNEVPVEIKLTSDGHTPLTGTTIIRAKSNITNN